VQWNHGEWQSRRCRFEERNDKRVDALTTERRFAPTPGAKSTCRFWPMVEIHLASV